jgi:hypothetical protein
VETGFELLNAYESSERLSSKVDNTLVGLLKVIRVVFLWAGENVLKTEQRCIVLKMLIEKCLLT